MGTTIADGPDYIYGLMGNLPVGFGAADPDPNLDAGPSMLYQGDFYPDVRFYFPKDKVQGYTGVVPGTTNNPGLVSVDQIPATFGTALIAANQGVTSGVAMTLVTAQAVGIAPGINIRPNSLNPLFSLNSGGLVSVIGIDFGFQFCNVVSQTGLITVADTTQFSAGEPLVIAGAGNALGTTALYTNVLQINSPTTLTVGAGQQGLLGQSSGGLPALTANTLPIGTGNYWGPSENGFPTPDAALPALAAGPGLFYDPRQMVSRNFSVTAAVGAAGGVVQMQGYDVYGQFQTENITAVAGSTVYGKKTFKYFFQGVPQFTDAGHNYSIGTGDTFGINFRSTAIEFMTMFFNGTYFSPTSGTNTGWTAADTTNPATSITGDPRGTWQVSANGAGNAWAQTGTAASNGTVVSLAMSGRRLMIMQLLRLVDNLYCQPNNPISVFGVKPA